MGWSRVLRGPLSGNMCMHFFFYAWRLPTENHTLHCSTARFTDGQPHIYTKDYKIIGANFQLKVPQHCPGKPLA